MAVLPLLLVFPLFTTDAATAAISVNAATATAGQRIVVSGVRFPPRQRGVLALDGSIVLGRLSADRLGAFSTRVTIPRDAAAGVHTIAALPETGDTVGIALASTTLSVVTGPIAGGSPTPTPTSTPSPRPSPTATPAPTSSPAQAPPSATPTPTQVAQPPLPTAPPGGAPAGYYVAPGGSDSATGTFAQPWRTPAHAAQVAPAGSTIWLRGGTYAGFDITRSGLTFSSYPGELAIVADSIRENVIEFSAVTGGALENLVIEGSVVQYGSGVKVDESSGVTISGSTIRNNRTWGIVVVRSSNVRIEGNDITGNANGIEERYADGLVIAGNQIHGNVTMVDSGRGMQGINFYKSTGSVTVVGNALWDNETHFEVYGASNLSITDNVTWNGHVMETGTDGAPCDGNRFVRNVGYRGAGFGGSAHGLILRCASSMLVAHNTLDGFDQFALDIVDGTLGVPYGGSIAGLRVLNNILVGGRAYSIDTALPGSVQIDYNLLYNVGSSVVYGDHLAYVKGIGNLDSLADFTSATGYDAYGRFGDPLFANRGGANFALIAGSPAIDAGMVVLGDGFTRAAPDLGRHELP
jgi:parallel beta-helix repeat protein